ncbi:hypothetical protein [Desulfurispira natronophila]|uniref:Uncharacterized protein n=1 Tax=Desulfurispira natronophila TaxID=682562 RepID=A0A7W8DHY0_9BACT|nr:hypothetical protein [Desulfurispira natronophila]MBB5022919.1 hypothetical protein [Desulfurispira natronophila]
MYFVWGKKEGSGVKAPPHPCIKNSPSLAIHVSHTIKILSLPIKNQGILFSGWNFSLLRVVKVFRHLFALGKQLKEKLAGREIYKDERDSVTTN